MERRMLREENAPGIAREREMLPKERSGKWLIITAHYTKKGGKKKRGKKKGKKMAISADIALQRER